MPSVSPKQHKFFEAVAHSPSFAKDAGVPQSVGKDFARADLRAGITKTHNGQPIQHRTNGSSPRSMDEHMTKQRTQGRTVAKIAGDFGKSPTTVSRRTLRQGFVRKGSAV